MSRRQSDTRKTWAYVGSEDQPVSVREAQRIQGSIFNHTVSTPPTPHLVNISLFVNLDPACGFTTDLFIQECAHVFLSKDNTVDVDIFGDDSLSSDFKYNTFPRSTGITVKPEPLIFGQNFNKQIEVAAHPQVSS